MTRRLFFVASIAMLIASLGGTSANAYHRQFQDVDGRRVFLRWPTATVRYSINTRSVPGVTTAQLQSVMSRAFGRWQDVSTAAITFQFNGLTDAEPLDFDGINTIGFLNEPDLEGLLGLTLSTFDTVTGEVVEADIFFNSAEAWSVDEDGEADRFDLESVAVHESGHLTGLDHSALGYFEEQEDDVRLAGAEAIMFPFAFDPGNIALRDLRPDDIAGISAIYPDGGFASETGTLEGRVVRDGVGLYGAHVLALNPLTGEMVGGFSLTRNGDFRIEGLEPGNYVIRAEPIDDIGIDSFFQDPSIPVDIAFGPTFLDRFITVAAGRASATFDVTVRAR